MTWNTSAIGRPGASLRVPARELLGDRVQVLDAAVGVGRDDRVADRLQRDLRLFLLLVQLQFRALAHGDVGDRAFVAGDLAVLVADDARVLEHGDQRAVAPPQLAFGLAHHAVAVQRREDRGRARPGSRRSSAMSAAPAARRRVS